MLGLFYKLNCSFTESEKEECKPIIYKIINLVNIARQKGVLVLEMEMEQEQSLFLKTAIGLVVDGTDPALVKQILQNIILADKYVGSDLLSRLLIAEGILSVQQGENPRIIALKLSAMLGEKYILQIDEMLNNKEYGLAGFHQFMETIKDKRPLPESEKFESVFLQMDNRSIQVVILNIDYSCLLKALYGCSYTLICKITENVSTGTCLRISSDWEANKFLSKEHVIECQEKILREVTILQSRGEIIISHKYSF